MGTEANLAATEQSRLDAMRCTPEEALSIMADLAQDTRAMASALAGKLNDLAACQAGSDAPLTVCNLAEVRDMAAALEEFLSWAAEDPITLGVQLKCINADLPIEL